MFVYQYRCPLYLIDKLLNRAVSDKRLAVSRQTILDIFHLLLIAYSLQLIAGIFDNDILSKLLLDNGQPDGKMTPHMFDNQALC